MMLPSVTVRVSAVKCVLALSPILTKALDHPHRRRQAELDPTVAPEQLAACLDGHFDVELERDPLDEEVVDPRTEVLAAKCRRRAAHDLGHARIRCAEVKPIPPRARERKHLQSESEERNRR